MEAMGKDSEQGAGKGERMGELLILLNMLDIQMTLSLRAVGAVLGPAAGSCSASPG